MPDNKDSGRGKHKNKNEYIKIKYTMYEIISRDIIFQWRVELN